jgi:D-inositol-3-phosphate glycosyltransferase
MEAAMEDAVLVISVRADPLTPIDGGVLGGQQVMVRTLATALQQRGWSVDVLTLAQSDRARPVDALGPRGRVIRLPRALYADDDAFVDMQPRLVEAALDRLPSGRYRLVHSHYWMSGHLAQPLAERLGLPWVHTPYTLAAWVAARDQPVASRRAELEQRQLAAAARVVAVHRSQASEIAAMVPAARVVTVTPGVDLSLFFPRDPGPVLRALGLKRRPAVYVGRLARGYGLWHLLEAMATRRLPGEFCLVIIGGDPGEVQDGRPRDPELRRRVEALGGRVLFLGPMPHRAVAPYLAAARLLVAPSRAPTIGMAVLEALASGVPVVGTAVPGIRDWVRDGWHGVLVPPGDGPALLDRVLELWADADRCRRLGNQGRLRVARRYRLSAVARRMDTVYRSLTGQPKPLAGFDKTSPVG